jgi:hypothetical protein
MPLRACVIAASGLGSLVILIDVSRLAPARTAEDIHTQLDTAEIAIDASGKA